MTNVYQMKKLLAAAVLVLAACSGAPRPAPTTAKSEAPTVVTIGRSLEGGRALTLGQDPTIEVPLPPLSDRCSELTTGGDWVAFSGSVPARLQLGATSVALGGAQLPAATLWRRHARRGCWVKDELFVRPAGRAALTLKAPGGGSQRRASSLWAVPRSLLR